MVLAIYLSFIDLVQLCYTTHLTKLSAKNAPIGTQAVSLDSGRCLQISWLYLDCLQLYMIICTFVVWLSDIQRENCFWFLRINLFLSSSPKSESQAGWDQDYALGRWYQFPLWTDIICFERLYWSYSIKLELEIRAEYFPYVSEAWWRMKQRDFQWQGS